MNTAASPQETDDADLLAEVHAELDECNARINKIALGLAFLKLLALWCWSQEVTP